MMSNCSSNDTYLRVIRKDGSACNSSKIRQIYGFSSSLNFFLVLVFRKFLVFFEEIPHPYETRM